MSARAIAFAAGLARWCADRFAAARGSLAEQLSRAFSLYPGTWAGSAAVLAPAGSGVLGQQLGVNAGGRTRPPQQAHRSPHQQELLPDLVKLADRVVRAVLEPLERSGHPRERDPVAQTALGRDWARALWESTRTRWRGSA